MARSLLLHIDLNGYSATTGGQQLGHRSGIFFNVASCDHHRGPGSGQACGHTQAYAAVAAGDDGDFAAQIKQIIHRQVNLKLVRRRQTVLRGDKVGQHGHVFLRIALRLHGGE